MDHLKKPLIITAAIVGLMFMMSFLPVTESPSDVSQRNLKAQQITDLAREYRQAGELPEQAQAHAERVMNPVYGEADRRRSAARQSERETDTAAVMGAACKADPGISYC